VSQYLTKGSLVLVEGRIQTRSWDGRDGSKQYRTEIIAERIQFGPKNDRGSNAGLQAKPQIETMEIKADLPEIDIDEENIRAEDLPF